MLMIATRSRQWRLMASFFCLMSPCSFAQQTVTPSAPVVETTVATSVLKPFTAQYEVYRSGDKHGEAERHLKQLPNGYELGFTSDITYLIYQDKRIETSQFSVEDGHVRPWIYQMNVERTGPDKFYKVSFDREKQQIRVGKKQEVKTLDWNNDWLDTNSFHAQLVLDLQAGKTDFVYQVLNRDGNPREYKYKVAGEELLSLPFGQVKAIRIERYGQTADRQVHAWVAPELNYMLVRLWQAEDNVELFDVQLKSYQMQ
jgi:hypothetical protein